ncbi:MAG: gamma-glutamylcyclotransferase [Candidatus Eremiobacteraeota bacterium]|nr:gamma-glutamylcyclotransferase [Candidatus Eremiobacteraeota bacterium]MBV8353687.1 gamma-glutamylcyclotransferase [Candidatus Eremiobacteraeota bacterium]
MLGRAPRAKPLIRALLVDHRLTFESNEPAANVPAYFANVRPALGNRVHGALYDVSPADVAALDAYEEIGRGIYEKRVLGVTSADGRRVPAIVYRMSRDGKPERFGIPSRRQLEQIRAGYADWGIDRRLLELALTPIPRRG